RRDRPRLAAHQDARDGVRPVEVPRPVSGRVDGAHPGEGRGQGVAFGHQGRDEADAGSDGRVEGEPRGREGQLSGWRRSTRTSTYIVFDVLYVGDKSVMGLSQMERKAILPDLVEVDDRVVLSDYIEGRGVDYYNAVIARGLEGIIAKHKETRYQMGKRSKDWVKIKKKTTLDAIICGITAGE